MHRNYKSIESVVGSVTHWSTLNFIGETNSEHGASRSQAVSGFCGLLSFQMVDFASGKCTEDNGKHDMLGYVVLI